VSQITWERRHEAFKAIWEKLDALAKALGSSGIDCVQATAAGNTTVHTTTSGKSFKVKFIMLFNSGAGSVTVYLRDGASGAAKFQATLTANTGITINLLGCNWQLTQGNNLVVNLSVAGTVDVTVLGEEA